MPNNFLILLTLFITLLKGLNDFIFIFLEDFSIPVSNDLKGKILLTTSLAIKCFDSSSRAL